MSAKRNEDTIVDTIINEDAEIPPSPPPLLQGLPASNEDNEEVSNRPRSPQQEEHQLGAFALGGPGPSPNGDEYTITAQSHTTNENPLNPASEPVTVEARLVQGSKEDLDVLQEQLCQQQEQIGQQQEQIDHIRRERENIVVGQVLAPDEENPPAPTNREEPLKMKLLLLPSHSCPG